MDVRIKEIARHYGATQQVNQLVEEMGELLVAINKCRRGNFTDKLFSNMAEEIADVEIMLNQVKYLLELEREVEIYTHEKIERQLDRIDEELDGDTNDEQQE